MNEKKLIPRASKLLVPFTIIMVILLLIVYFSFGSRFAWAYKDYGASSDSTTIEMDITKDIIILVVFILLYVVFGFILVKRNFYEITNSGIIHHRLTQQLVYDYKDILYIDEEYTKKHKTLLFYTNKGNDRFLVLDKNEQLLSLVLKNCHHLITREEYLRRFPKTKM